MNNFTKISRILQESKASAKDLEDFLQILMQTNPSKKIGSGKEIAYIYNKPSFKKIKSQCDAYLKGPKTTKNVHGDFLEYTVFDDEFGDDMIGVKITINNYNPGTWVKVKA